MFPELNAKLRHGPTNLPKNQLIMVDEVDNADGSFLSYHFLSLFLRSPPSSKSQIYLLSCRHSLSHYISVLAKLGAQFNRALEQNRCRIFDLMKFYIEIFESGENNMNLAYLDLKELLKRIESDLSEFRADHQSPLLFLIDDLSVLLDLTDNLSDVFYFVTRLHHLIMKHETSCFVVKLNSYSEMPPDSSYNLLRSALLYYSNWLLKVRPLKTGWSREVNGELVIESQENDIRTSADVTKFLYRLSDRNVIFAAPGLMPGVSL